MPSSLHHTPSPNNISDSNSSNCNATNSDHSMSSDTNSDDSEGDHSSPSPQPTVTKWSWPFEGTKKEISPKAKKSRMGVTSSIRTALESERPQHGILNYFKKATESECAAYQARMAEEITMRMENEVWTEGKARQTKHALIQRRAKERKQEQRRREKDREILAGLRSPGGTKRRVSLHRVHSLHSLILNLKGQIPSCRVDESSAP